MTQVMVSQPLWHYCSVCGVKIHYQSKSGLCAKCNAKRSGLQRQKNRFKKNLDNEKYALLKVSSCPKCGKPGSLHEKWVLNKAKKRYHYFYIAHYLPSYKVRWCYCP